MGEGVDEGADEGVAVDEALTEEQAIPTNRRQRNPQTMPQWKITMLKATGVFRISRSIALEAMPMRIQMLQRPQRQRVTHTLKAIHGADPDEGVVAEVGTADVAGDEVDRIRTVIRAVPMTRKERAEKDTEGEDAVVGAAGVEEGCTLLMAPMARNMVLRRVGMRRRLRKGGVPGLQVS